MAQTDLNTRDWPAWLQANLKFPFEANRIYDADAEDGLLTLRNPFPVGQRLTVLGLADPPMNDYDGVIVKVQRGANKGEIPLANLEVTPPENANYRPVKEFATYWAGK
jgi:hypothetical protein